MQLTLAVNRTAGSGTPIYDVAGSFDINTKIRRMRFHQIVRYRPVARAVEATVSWTRRMKIIDLSRPIYEGMPVFPGDPEVKIQTLGAAESENGLVRRISLGSHTGTHVDAFAHMHPDGRALDDIPLERFFGPAQAVRPHQLLPPRVGLIFVEAPAAEDSDRIAEAVPPFVAGDLPAELERSLLDRQILTYTDLVNLDQLPEGIEFTFYGLPLPIEGGDGSPVRAVAIIP